MRRDSIRFDIVTEVGLLVWRGRRAGAMLGYPGS